MSRLNVGISASTIARTARSTFAGSCVRPSAASTCGDIDCTPMLTRLTPPDRYVRNISTVTSSGLHSTVTSASSRRGIAAITFGQRIGAAPASACHRRRRWCRRRACRRPPRARSRSTRPPRYAIDEVGPIGPRRECAVVALRGAEGDVEIHPELVHASIKARFRSKRDFGQSAVPALQSGQTDWKSRSSASRRAPDLVDRHVEHRRDRPDVVAAHRDDAAVEVLALHLDQLQVPRQHLERRTLQLDQLDDVDRQLLVPTIRAPRSLRRSSPRAAGAARPAPRRTAPGGRGGAPTAPARHVHRRRAPTP